MLFTLVGLLFIALVCCGVFNFGCSSVLCWLLYVVFAFILFVLCLFVGLWFLIVVWVLGCLFAFSCFVYVA